MGEDQEEICGEEVIETLSSASVPMARTRGSYGASRAASNHRLHIHPPHPPNATYETETTMASSPPPGFEDRTPNNIALAFDSNAQSIMALNNNNPPPNNLFPNFLESPVAGNNPNNNMGSVPRLAPSPLSQQPQHQINNSTNGNGIGMNGLNMGMPMNAGHQMDVNMLYQKVVELSEVLKENREKTQGIISSAEELAVSSLRFRLELIVREVLARTVMNLRCLLLGTSPKDITFFTDFTNFRYFARAGSCSRQ